MTHAGVRLNQIAMLSSSTWQMSYGERAALEGVLAQLRPRLALEIGTAQGGSLSRIASYSEEVHSFDVVAPPNAIAALDNVVWHTGDSHVLLPQVCSELATAGRSVDFVLVDGDHTAEGVRRDVEDILAADAIHHAVVLMHDTMNGVVRMGIESVDFEQHSKVTFVDLDFVPGYLARYEPYRLELWGGLGLIVIDSDQSRKPDRSFRQDRFHELVALVRPARDIMVELERSGEHLDRKQPAEIEELLRERWQDGAAELAGLKAELGARERRIRSLERSLSWRITSPLRSLRQKLPSRRLDR